MFPSSLHKLGFALTFVLAGFVGWFNYPAGLYLFVFPIFIVALGMGKQQKDRDTKLRA